MDIKEYLAGKNIGKNHPWELARVKVIYDIIKRHIPPHAKTMCDIGCGDVFFIENLSKKYQKNNFIAIDTAFNSELIDILKNRLNSERVSFYQNIDNAEAASIKADVVFLMDVMEHIENDQQFIDKLLNSSIIKAETLLMITVPAFQSLYCTHDSWLGHYRRYTLPQLKKRFALFQRNILEEGYFFKSLVFPRFLEKKIKKQDTENFNKGTDVSNWEGGKLSTFVYKNILWFDYIFFNKILRWEKLGGLSCYLLIKIKK